MSSTDGSHQNPSTEDSSIWDLEEDDGGDTSPPPPKRLVEGRGEGGEGVAASSSSSLLAACVNGQLTKRKRFNPKIAARSIEMDEWEELRKKDGDRKRRRVPKATIDLNGPLEKGMTLGEIIKRKAGLNTVRTPRNHALNGVYSRSFDQPVEAEEEDDDDGVQYYGKSSVRSNHQQPHNETIPPEPKCEPLSDEEQIEHIVISPTYVMPKEEEIALEQTVKEEVADYEPFSFTDEKPPLMDTPSQLLPIPPPFDLFAPKEEEEELIGGENGLFEMVDIKEEEEFEEEEEEIGMEWEEEESTSTIDDESIKEKEVDFEKRWHKSVKKKKKLLRMKVYAALGVEPPKGRPPANEMVILKKRLKEKFGEKNDLFKMVDIMEEEDSEEEEDEKGMEGPSTTSFDEDTTKEEEADFEERWNKTAKKKKKLLRMKVYAALGVEPPKGRPPSNEIAILKKKLKKKFGEKAKSLFT